jgi:hypothetical protein
MADRLGVESIDREGQTVVIRFRPQARVDAERMVHLVTSRGDVALVPPAGLRLDLRGPESRPRPPAPARSAPGASRGAEAGRPGSAWPNLGRRPITSSDLLAARRPRATADSASPASWWTARATAGEVTPGFTKAEMTRPAREDPRAASGVFTKVGGLLGDLLGPGLG